LGGAFVLPEPACPADQQPTHQPGSMSYPMLAEHFIVYLYDPPTRRER
jgi:hypothetical protein